MKIFINLMYIAINNARITHNDLVEDKSKIEPGLDFQEALVEELTPLTQRVTNETTGLHASRHQVQLSCTSWDCRKFCIECDSRKLKGTKTRFACSRCMMAVHLTERDSDGKWHFTECWAKHLRTECVSTSK